MADVCLTHLTSHDVPLTVDFNDEDAVEEFEQRFPFYAYAATEFLSYVQFVDQTAEEFDSLQNFFTPTTNCSFIFWHQYTVAISRNVTEIARLHVTWSPLYLAASYNLVKTVLRMVSEGADVNNSCGGWMPPLYCAIAMPLAPDDRRLYFNGQAWHDQEDNRGSLPIMEALVSHGAQLDYYVGVTDADTGEEIEVDAFGLAFLQNDTSVCKFLLENGARIDEDLLTYIRDHDQTIYTFRASIVDLVLSGHYVQDPALRKWLNGIRNEFLEQKDSNQNISPDSGDLILAIRYRNEAVFNRILEGGADVEARDTEGRTALYVAVETHQHLIVSALLQKNTDILAVDNNKNNPLLLAYSTWELSEVQDIFRSENCSIFTPIEVSQIVQIAYDNDDDKMLLHILSQSDHPLVAIELPADFFTNAAVLRVLHEHALLDSSQRLCAMLGACEDGDSAVLSEGLAQCTAAEMEEFRIAVSETFLPYNGEVLRVLIESGLSVFSKDDMLITACHGGHQDVVKSLLAFEANANFLTSGGSRPVHHAACHLGILQSLHNMGANPIIRNRDGETALYLASRGGALDCVEWLLNNGVCIDAKSVDGRTALYDAAQAGHDLVCERLIKSGADFQVQTKRKRVTPLHCAAYFGHLKVVETLLTFRPDLLARDVGGGTPLHNAAFMGHLDIVKKILVSVPAEGLPARDVEGSHNLASELDTCDSGAENDRDPLDRRKYTELQLPNGDTPLMLAIASGHLEVLEALLQEGGSLEIANHEGNLPLHYSVNYQAILTRLLRLGLDVNATNNAGNTVLHLAARNSNRAAIQVILEWNPDVNAVNKSFMTALDIVEDHAEGWEVCQALLLDAGAKKSDNPLKTCGRIPIRNTEQVVLKKFSEFMVSLPTRLTRECNQKQAEEICRTVLDAQHIALNSSHPNLLVLMNNVAYLLCLQIEQQEAEDLLQRTLALRKTILRA